MTNREAIQFLNNMIGEEHGRSIGAEGFYRELCAYHVDALRMAIKALEQEPCDDAISRQAALDAFGLSEKTRKYGGDHSGYDTMMLYEIQQTLEDLPTVTPKQRTGHWIVHPKGVYAHLVCDRCLTCAPYDCKTNYCPTCGIKMVEPQESEDKDGGV